MASRHGGGVLTLAVAVARKSFSEFKLLFQAQR